MDQFLRSFIDIFFNLLSFAIFGRILLSWFPHQSGGKIGIFLHDITEPLMGPFRRLIPRIGMLDISPIVLLLVLDLVRTLLLSLLSYFGSL